MMVTVDPQVQYSVDEVMSEPESFDRENIFVRGIVLPGSMDYDELVFTLKGTTEELIVDFNKSPIPDGFDEGRTIAVRGVLKIKEMSDPKIETPSESTPALTR